LAKQVFHLLAPNAQQARDWEIWIGGLIVSAAVGVVLLVAKWLLHCSRGRSNPRLGLRPLIHQPPTRLMRATSGSWCREAPTEGWSRDVTVDIADEPRRHFVEYDEVPEHVLDFMDEHRR